MMIRTLLERLIGLDEKVWARYLFSRDPVADHIDEQRKYDLYTGAVKCGAELAASLVTGKNGISIGDIAEQSGIHLELTEEAVEHLTVFALFMEPDRIIINAKNAAATDEFIDETGLRDLTGQVKTLDVLCAHEVFHFFEFQRPDMFTMQKHVRLWKLGPFYNDSSIPVLGEIGAMSFTREICRLDYTPSIFDVLMLCPMNMQRAETVYENIMSFLDSPAV